MNIILHILVNALAFFIGAKLLSGVNIKGYVQALILALVVGVLNFTLGNFLTFITFGLLRWGLLALVLDAIIIMLADFFLKDVKVKSFWWALGLALLVAVVNAAFSQVF